MTTQAVRRPDQPALPRTTEAAVLHGAKDLRIEQKPLKALGPNDVLVEMRSGGICGSDMHYFADGRNGTNVLRQPTVLGHEGAGVVIAAGETAAVAAGTAVVIEPALPCGTCPTCVSGRYNLCPSGTCFGSPPTDGLFARHVVVPGSCPPRAPGHPSRRRSGQRSNRSPSPSGPLNGPRCSPDTVCSSPARGPSACSWHRLPQYGAQRRSS